MVKKLRASSLVATEVGKVFCGRCSYSENVKDGGRGSERERERESVCVCACHSYQSISPTQVSALVPHVCLAVVSFSLHLLLQASCQVYFII